jgi:hypothetical protein
MGCLYTVLIGFTQKERSMGFSVYIHHRGAFSVARFDNQGNARAFTSWNERQTGSTFFYM